MNVLIARKIFFFLVTMYGDMLTGLKNGDHLQYIQISNYYTVYLKLIPEKYSVMSIISQYRKKRSASVFPCIPSK